MLFESFIIGSAAGGIIKASWDLYDKISAIRTGGTQIERYLDQITSRLGKQNVAIERLSDNVLYARDLDAVRDATLSRQRRVEDLRQVRATLEPVAKAVGEDIVSSAMIWTPDKLKNAMANPWETLLYIQPLTLAKAPDTPSLVPFLFEHGDTRYMGWQTKGMVRVIFDCEYDETLLKPAAPSQLAKVHSLDSSNPPRSPSGAKPRLPLSALVAFRDGQDCVRREDHEQAVFHYRKAAEQGHVPAQNNLGLMYKSGRGVARDDTEAVRWYRKGAEQGNASAQINLKRLSTRS